MKIKKDDTIIVITGKDKGKTAKVTKAFPRLDMILVEGVNMHKRHRRPTREGQKGQIVEVAHPIHISNVKKARDEGTSTSTSTAKKPRAKKTSAKPAKTVEPKA